MLYVVRNIQGFLAKNRLCRSGVLEIGVGSRIQAKKIIAKSCCKLTIGIDSIIESSFAFDREGGRILVGDRTFIGGSMLVCAEKIEIGNDVLISWGCTIVDHNSHPISWSHRSDDILLWAKGEKKWSNIQCAPVKIGDKAWIGFNSIILKGVAIGEGAIVGAGSVVTKNVPPYTIVAGNPARVIREIPVNER